MSLHYRSIVALLLCASSLLAACSREARKARHMERGDWYFSEEQYRDAILEYQNVLQLDSENPHAVERVGLALFALGHVGEAFPFLQKARGWDPENVEIRMRLATIFFIGRQLQEARVEASTILAERPAHLDALVLMAQLAASLEEVDLAIERLHAVGRQHDRNSTYHLALGSLYMKKRDPSNAEREFQLAVEREENAVVAHQALARFYEARGDWEQAEREFQRAYVLSPGASVPGLQLADFYLGLGRRDEAKGVLSELIEREAASTPARQRLAAILFDEGQVDQSLEHLAGVLEENPEYAPALLLRGRIRLARREVSEALQDFRRILRFEPDHAPARYQLALAYVQNGDLLLARSELRQVLDSAPRYADALLALAELEMQTGHQDVVVEDLASALESLEGNARAHQLLVLAYLAEGRPEPALEQLGKFQEMAPRDPAGPYLTGLGLRLLGRRREARDAFEQALAMEPGHVQALNQLVVMAFEENQPGVALARARKQVELVPDSGMVHFVLGSIYLRRSMLEDAEKAFRRAVEVDPNLADAYTQLGNVSASQGRYDDALARFNEALELDPDNAETRARAGAIYQLQGDVVKALEYYEKAVWLRPGFVAAANNLAFLYAEQGSNLGRALEVIQLARQEEPDNPHLADTLGWILYKQGLYDRAVTLLADSSAKLPESAQVHYHLGMAHWKLGNREQARRAFSRALELDPGFSGAEEARQALVELG